MTISKLGRRPLIFLHLTRCFVLCGSLFIGGSTILPAQNESTKRGGGGKAVASEVFSSDPLELGRDLAAKGELRKALPFLREAADLGRVEAQELCALVLVKLDQPSLYGEARTRLASAEKMGSIVALEEQARLAVEGGLGEEPNFGLAKQLLKRAISAPGASESFFLLGKMAAEGLGRERDAAIAVSFMRRGEEAGSASSMFALGQLYLGEGGLVDQDLAQARELFKKAYARGNGAAAFYLGMMEERLQDGEPDWQEAREWFEKASQLRYAAAFKKLGDYALEERASKKEDAFGFFQQGAELKSAEAPYMLGLLYRSGQTVPMDQVAAAAWMRIAADRGYPLAQNQLALWLLKGLGVTSNFEEAVILFEKSALQGYPPAQFNTAIILLDGENGDEERKRAVSLLKTAAGKGYAEAAAKLANVYNDGKIFEQDLLEAAYWAAIASSDEAFKELAAETVEKLNSEQKKKLSARLKKP